MSAGNPLIGMRNIKIARPRDLPRANRPWSDRETVAVLEAAAGGLRLALALACYAGMRGGDIVRVTWTIYDDKTLEWQQGKTGDPMWLPALLELRAILDEAQRIVGERRRPQSNCSKSGLGSERTMDAFGKNLGVFQNGAVSLAEIEVISTRKSTAPGGARGLQTRWRTRRRLR